MTMPQRRLSFPPRELNLSQWFWPHGLLLLSLWTLAVPLMLWGGLWLRAPWNILFVGVIAFALWGLFRNTHSEGLGGMETTTLHELSVTACWAFLPLALMCLGSGIGGWGAQSEDWNKHNAVLADLVRSDWPVRYWHVSSSVHLTYYTAFYLPAALVGKLLGWTAALVMHQAGALFVLGLLSAWLAWIAGPRTKWLGVAFAAFGGLDYLASKILAAAHGKPFQLAPFSLEWWEKPVPWWGYYSHVTELFWIPHGALAGWLAAAILLRGASPLALQQNEVRSQSLLLPSPSSWRDVSFDVVLCALLPLWNPWAWLGCLPLLGLRVAQQLRSKNKITWWPWLFLVALWAMQFGYLMSRVPLPPDVAGGRGYRFTFTAPEFIRQFGATYFESWVAFTLVEFGFYAALCLLLWRRAKQASPLAPFLGVSVALMAVLPLFHYGLYNDLLRSVVAPLVVVCLACISALKVPATRGTVALKAVLVTALCIGGLHSVQYAINVASSKKHSWQDNHRLVMLPELKKTPTVYELYAHDHRPQLLTQYIGRDDSLWARWFLKPAPK